MSEHGTTLGQKIRVLRRQMGMTQADLAGDDFTKSFISQIEKNQARPSLKSLRVFAQRLNRPLSYFLDDEPGVSETPPEVVRSLTTGDLLERQGKYEEALNVYDTAIKQCGQADYAHRGQAYRQRARALQELNQLKAAVQSLKLASEEFRLAKDAAARAAVDRNLGEVYARLGQQDKALHHFERALLLYEEVIAPHANAESSFPLIQLLTDLGLLTARQEPGDIALNYLQRAETLSEKFNVYYRWGETCQTIGRILTGRDEGPKAIAYMYRAAAFFEATTDDGGLVAALIDLGMLRFKEGGKRAAQQYLDKATDIAKRAKQENLISLVHEALAQIALAEDDIDGALSLYEQALAACRDDRRTANLHQALAKLLRQKEQWDEAARHLEAVAAQLEKAKATKDLIETYKHLAEVYEAAGQADEAARCLQRSFEIYRGN